MRRAFLALAVVAVAAIACGELVGASPDSSAPPSADAAAGSDAPNDVADVDADAGAADVVVDAAPKLVFVTTALTHGDMTFFGAQSKGGPIAADTQCKAEAAAVGRDGTYVAWLSTGTRSPYAMVDEGSWELVDHTPVFPSRAAILSSSLKHAIDKTAQNMPPTNTSVPQVWTGTKPDGSLDFANCGDWLESAMESAGSTGLFSGAAANWTQLSMSSCDTALPVYCFQAR